MPHDLSNKWDAVESHDVIGTCISAVWTGNFFRGICFPESEIHLRTGSTWTDIQVMTENWVNWNDWPNNVMKKHFIQVHQDLEKIAYKSKGNIHTLDRNIGLIITYSVKMITTHLIWGFNESLEDGSRLNIEKNLGFQREWNTLVHYTPAEIEAVTSVWVTHVKMEKPFLFE